MVSSSSEALIRSSSTMLQLLLEGPWDLSSSESLFFGALFIDSGIGGELLFHCGQLGLQLLHAGLEFLQLLAQRAGSLAGTGLRGALILAPPPRLAETVPSAGLALASFSCSPSHFVVVVEIPYRRARPGRRGPDRSHPWWCSR